MQGEPCRKQEGWTHRGQPRLDNRSNGLMYSLSTIIRAKSVLEETSRA